MVDLLCYHPIPFFVNKMVITLGFSGLDGKAAFSVSSLAQGCLGFCHHFSVLFLSLTFRSSQLCQPLRTHISGFSPLSFMCANQHILARAYLLNITLMLSSLFFILVLIFYFSTSFPRAACSVGTRSAFLVIIGDDFTSILPSDLHSLSLHLFNL